MTKILALDIASRVGVAYSPEVERGNQLPFDTWDLSVYKDDYGLMGQWLRHNIRAAIISYDIDMMAIERPFVSRGSAVYLLGGLAFMAHATAREMHIPRAEFSPASVKKFFTGNGKAKKGDMIKIARHKGYDITNSDEADAVAVMMMAQSVYEKDKDAVKLIDES